MLLLLNNLPESHMRWSLMRKKLKISFIAAFSLALAALITGASFHGFRVQTENVEMYKLGVTMGIVMISLFGAFLLVGIVLLAIYKKTDK